VAIFCCFDVMQKNIFLLKKSVGTVLPNLSGIKCLNMQHLAIKVDFINGCLLLGPQKEVPELLTLSYTLPQLSSHSVDKNICCDNYG
jgi:hypothetical protein